MNKFRALAAQVKNSSRDFARRVWIVVSDFGKRQRREIFIALVLAIVFAFIAGWAFKYWEKINEIRTLQHIRNGVATVVAYDKNNQPVSLGCGVFIEPNGKLVTSYHVIKTPKVEARLASGAYYKLNDDGVLQEDVRSGVTVLQFNGKGIPHVSLGDSDGLEVGERVLAFTAQAGLECSVSEGIVSQPKTKLGSGLADFIQFTGLPASRANEGVLFNPQGEIVGVISSSMIPPDLQRSVSALLAIPINHIKALIQGRGVRLSEGNPEYFYSLGILAENKRQYDKAIDYFQKAISTDGKYAEAYLELGGIYYEQGAYDQELQAYQKAFKYAPTNVDVSFYLATAYEDVKMYNEAIAQYNITLRIKPDHKDSLYQLSILYITRGEKTKAAELARKLGDLDPGLARELELLLSRTR